ncbi:MAG: hypothetical protein H7338_19970, partial [Candidatus Sericytochromatia bacterium]|nr:hypothetical protein [Candidatus Sericytochromatia bacterium]
MTTMHDRDCDPQQVLAGGGEMGALMRAMDWSKTPVGPVETWPQSLRTVLSILLISEQPMFLWWGEELIQFYNDSYMRVVAGRKHPAALGQRGAECWKEAWHLCGPLIDTVFAGGATYVNKGLVHIDRDGFLEECYFSYGFTPVRDETGRVAGVFVVTSETTGHVIGERRLALLRQLSLRTALDRHVADVFCSVEAMLAPSLDLSFALIYEVRDGIAMLVTCAGLARGTAAAPTELTLDDHSRWPIGNVVRSGQEALVEDLDARFGALHDDAWPEPVTRALVLPLTQDAGGSTRTVLVAGLSPCLALNGEYHNFIQLLSRQIADSLSSTLAREQEQQRAAKLAELDRAKTAFFSNVSHEFRTPLTLILGPLADALADREDPLSANQRERFEMARRNSLRLQKLVNTLLVFSRIEAGRVAAHYQPMDLSAVTADLASAFRSLVETA